MKFFNLDLHISVISDASSILTRLGHRVDDWTLSAQSWVLGRSPDRVEIVTAQNWRNIDQAMCDAFYQHYRDELASYDAFIVTHTPCLAMLYERWGKPVIVIASTRYEQPFTADADKWHHFNNYLRAKIDSGDIIPVANNRYDAAYAAYFTGRTWTVIPSLCDYTQARYAPQTDSFLYWSLFKGLHRGTGLVNRDSLRPGRLRRLANRLPLVPERRGFGWDEIARHTGIIHIPYNASVMSIFEHYTANIPLFFPTPDFLADLYRAHGGAGVLSQLSFNQVLGLPPGSAIPAGDDDPNSFGNIDTMMHWMRLADFYDRENMPHITYFSSFDTMRETMENANLTETSNRMARHNLSRKHRIDQAWKSLVDTLDGNMGKQAGG